MPEIFPSREIRKFVKVTFTAVLSLHRKPPCEVATNANILTDKSTFFFKLEEFLTTSTSSIPAPKPAVGAVITGARFITIQVRS